MKYEWIVEIDDDEGFHLEDAKWKQEVVRCKDCQYRGSTAECLERDDDWFCADGKRRKDASKTN